jgi:hypothetical protein
VKTALLTLLAMIAASMPVLAQAPGQPSTDVKIEQKQRRTIVKPPVDAGAGVTDADTAAGKLDEQHRAEQLRKKAMEPAVAPPLDENVVEGSRGRQLQELPKR